VVHCLKQGERGEQRVHRKKDHLDIIRDAPIIGR